MFHVIGYGVPVDQCSPTCQSVKSYVKKHTHTHTQQDTLPKYYHTKKFGVGKVSVVSELSTKSWKGI